VIGFSHDRRNVSGTVPKVYPVESYISVPIFLPDGRVRHHSGGEIRAQARTS